MFFFLRKFLERPLPPRLFSYRLSKIRSQITFAINLTTADPYLNTNKPTLSRLRLAIIYIRTERCATEYVLPYTSQNVPFQHHSDGLNQYFDTLSTTSHRISNSHFDSTTISNLTFYLTGDVITNNHSIKFGLFNLEDIDLNILIRNLLQLFLQLVNFLATFTNDNPGRAVQIVIVTSFSVRSITILDMLA